MSRSISLLEGIPDQEKRRHTLQSFRERLEGLLAPKLQSALSTRNETQQYSLHKIYCHLEIESQFIEAFCSFHTSTFIEYVFSLIPHE